MAAHNATHAASATSRHAESGTEGARDREIRVEQRHLNRVYRRLEEKIHEAEYLMDDAAKGGQVGTPGALAERDAQVFRAGVHLNRLNNEFEDFLFGRIDLLLGKDGARGPDGAYTSVEPADDAVRTDGAGDPHADIAETLHIGRLGVLDAEYSPLVIDWRAPAAAPFYRATPVAPGRVVRRRVIRSKGRQVLGVEDDLLRPELTASLDGEPLSIIGDGALMAALGRARGHTMRDIVSSIQAEQDLVIRAPANSVTEVEGGPGTGKTAVALHRAAYLLYQDRRRYAGGILIVSPTPLLVAYTEGVLPSLGEEGQVAIRALGSLAEAAETSERGGGSGAPAYDEPAVARVKGSIRMAKVLRKAARGALTLPGPAPVTSDDEGEEGQLSFAGLDATPRRGDGVPERLRVVAFGTRVELDARKLRQIRQSVLSGTAPVNLMRPRARRLLLDALWSASGGPRRYPDPELAAEAREAFDEDITTESEFTDFLTAWWPELTPRRVLAAMADEKRLSRWSGTAGGGRGRVLTQREVRLVARSLRRLDAEGNGPLSVHDVALLDELHTLLGTPARPRRREADPLDQLTGLDELTTYADRFATRPSRAERLERLRDEARTDYAHVIVDEAQDLTPMQWRMVGRRGRQATWTVVGDPAQSSWSDPDEAAAARDEALGTRPRRRFELTVNYRNPAEVAELASKVLALAMPGTVPPTAVRSTGLTPRFVALGGDPGAVVRAEVRRLLAEVDGTVGVVVAMARRAEAATWLAELTEPDGRTDADVERPEPATGGDAGGSRTGAGGVAGEGAGAGGDGGGEPGGRVVVLGSLEAKGLEYDATVVVSPAQIADESPAGLRVLYVALTRATQRLTVLSGERDDPDAAGVPDLLRD
ncbi:HelD family protein [Streptomyces sp. NPDC057702]|uniref:HelD family protein n=1 Tax=unclassified Streptomyces TaxID=2593676 RepID=UPI003685BE97